MKEQQDPVLGFLHNQGHKMIGQNSESEPF